MSTPVSSNNLNANPQPRPAIGRESTSAELESLGTVAHAASPNGTATGINAGLNVGSVVGNVAAEIKPAVGVKTLQGSYAGDHRAQGNDPVKATMDKIANPPCPREQMRGQQNSKHYQEDGTAFRGSEFASVESGS